MPDRPADLTDPVGPDDLPGALRALAPAAIRLDRDDLFYRAGRAGAPRPWPWVLATAGSTGVALTLAAVLLFRPVPTLVIEKPVYVERPPAGLPLPAPPVSVPAPQEPPDTPSPSPPPSPSPVRGAPSGLTATRRLQEHLLRWGLDGVAPEGPAEPAPAGPLSQFPTDSF